MEFGTRLRCAVICAIFAVNTPASAAAAGPDPAEVVRVLMEQDTALLRVGERLVVGAAGFCDGSGRSAGMNVQLLGQYRKDLRPAAQAALGLTTRPTITMTAPGGAAEASGLRPRDVIAAIDGHVFADGDSADDKSFAPLEAVHDVIEAALADGTAQLDIVRDGRPISVRLTPRPACRVRFDVRAGNTSKLLGKFADSGNKYVRVRSELVANTQADGELAAILAHEMAHLILRHSQRLSAKEARLTVRATEIEADRFSVYLLDAAGYSPASAVSFWTRWARTNDLGIFANPSHPGWKQRIATIEVEAARIAALKAAGQPVVAPDDLRRPR